MAMYRNIEEAWEQQQEEKESKKRVEAAKRKTELEVMVRIFSLYSVRRSIDNLAGSWTRGREGGRRKSEITLYLTRLHLGGIVVL